MNYTKYMLILSVLAVGTCPTLALSSATPCTLPYEGGHTTTGYVYTMRINNTFEQDVTITLESTGDIHVTQPWNAMDGQNKAIAGNSSADFSICSSKDHLSSLHAYVKLTDSQSTDNDDKFTIHLIAQPRDASCTAEGYDGYQSKSPFSVSCRGKDNYDWSVQIYPINKSEAAE